MYFDLHKNKDVYYHKNSALFMIINADKTEISINTCRSEVISNADWLFTFTDEKIFMLFITSLELNAVGDF